MTGAIKGSAGARRSYGRKFSSEEETGRAAGTCAVYLRDEESQQQS